MTRLAFAVRPPPEVLAVVDSMVRPAREYVVWSQPAQWVVKLRPLGHVRPELWGPLVEAVDAELDGASPAHAVLGPATERLAGQWLGVPVTGLDGLAEAVFAATEGLVPVTHPQPFRAELVLARGRVPADLAGAVIRAEWNVTAVLLVADRSAPGRSRLDVVGTVDLAG